MPNAPLTCPLTLERPSTLGASGFSSFPTEMDRPDGETIKLRFIGTNNNFIHPMHVHGGPFTVVARDGYTLAEGARFEADTVNVGPGQRYDVIWKARRPGKWIPRARSASQGWTSRIIVRQAAPGAPFAASEFATTVVLAIVKRNSVMKRLTLHAAALALALCAGIAHAQASKPDMGKMAMKPPTSAAQSGMPVGHGSQDMNKAMMSGMDSMRQMKLAGDTDKDFAMLMKMHHEQALDMAKVEVDQGKSPEMKAMARRIIAAQKKEIGEFDKWLQKHALER